MSKYTKKIAELRIADVPEVGGKNASLGEMIYYLKPKGVNIPDGFVTTADAFRYFIEKGKVKTKKGEVELGVFIKQTLAGLDTKKITDLGKRGKAIREAIKSANMPKDLADEILLEYKEMEKQYFKNVDVAVRSSATAEDLPGASFAGQQETFLNIRGGKALVDAVQRCFASLFTNRAISYRQDKGFDHLSVALSAGIQKMVRSDVGVSGVMFTLDTESGFKDTVLINGVWGLGEMIVQGEVIPDEFIVYKPFLQNTDSTQTERGLTVEEKRNRLVPIISKKLGKKDRKMIYSTGEAPTKVVNVSEKDKNTFVVSDKEIITLAKWGKLIEDHYTDVHKRWTPMDIEWAKDGQTKELYIVQARPETVQSQKDYTKIKEYKRLEDGKILAKGASVGCQIAVGKAHVILDAKDINKFNKGEVLITDMTDPDWEPIMKIASAIVTDKGGRTSHAAIVSRELGIPCIVGTEVITKKVKNGQMITIDTTGSDGYVFDGALKFKVIENDIKDLKKPKVKISLNIGTPETAFEKSFLPNDGVGLAREEFIIASDIGIHPNALIDYKALKVKAKNSKSKVEKVKINKIISEIDKRTVGHEDKEKFYVDKLSYGIGKIGAAFFPKEVIVRFSDFKTNEYRQLIGGELYEPQEENPMLGWRGASRYYHPSFAKAFILEVEAIKKVRNEMGLTNVQVMIPMCRTIEEGKKVIEIIEKNGLNRTRTNADYTRTLTEGNKSDGGVKIYVMCEIPANILLADEFLDIFDGMSIGSNDLTQLTLGIDRDGNERIRQIANEKNEAVKKFISLIIRRCNDRGKYIGICGQAPSDYSDFAEFIAKEGIKAISLNPDSVIKTMIELSKKGL